LKLELYNPALVSFLHQMLAQTYAISSQYDIAMIEIKNAVEIDPRANYSYRPLVRLCWKREKYDEAIDICIRSFGLTQDDWIYRDLIDTYIFNGDLEKAEMVCKKGDLNDWVVNAKLGDVYVLVGKFREAIETYNKCLKRQDSWTLVFEGLAKAYGYADTNLNEAEKIVKQNISEDDSSLCKLLGWIYYKKAKGKGLKGNSPEYMKAFDEVNKTLTVYQRSYPKDPTLKYPLAEVYFFLGNITEEMGKSVDAKKYYKECLRLNRGNTYIKRTVEKTLNKL
jgi:tetratricopeptide (TPR) repeat protein